LKKAGMSWNKVAIIERKAARWVLYLGDFGVSLEDD
jgi:hypothetical protein